MSKEKELRTSVVSFENFTAYDYIPEGSFYIKIATGDIIMMHSSKREECQAWVDENFPPKGKYRVIPTRDQKTKSKQENGEVSVRGVSTRRGQRR